jgi:hypothetical protein
MQRTFLALTLVMLATGVSVAKGQESQHAREQTVFRESEPFQHTVSLPAKVLHALLQTKEVKEALLDFAKKDDEQINPSKLFQAAEVHLRGPEEADLVVKGFPPVSGVDNSWFWIVLSPQSTPKIILWTGGDTLEVMATRTNGYRNIEYSWSSASGYTREWKYHYGGEQYLLWKETESKSR